MENKQVPFTIKIYEEVNEEYVKNLKKNFILKKN